MSRARLARATHDATLPDYRAKVIASDKRPSIFTGTIARDTTLPDYRVKVIACYNIPSVFACKNGESWRKLERAEKAGGSWRKLEKAGESWRKLEKAGRAGAGRDATRARRSLITA